MKNFKKLIKYLKPYKKWTFLASFLIIFEVIMDLLMPNIMANIINIGIKNSDKNYIIFNIILMIGLTFLGVLGSITSTYFAAKSSSFASKDIREKVFEKITKLSFLNLEKLKTGHLLTILTNDITLIGEVMMYLLRLIVRIPIILIGSVIMAIFISPKLSMILILVVPITIIIVSILMKKSFPKFQKLQEQIDDVNMVVRENINANKVVKNFVSEDYEIEKFRKSNDSLRKITINAVRTINITMPSVMLIVNLTIVVVLLIGGNSVINNKMAIGDVIAFIEYLTNILTSLLMASVIIVMLSHSEASALRVNQIFNSEEDIINKNKHKKEQIKGNIEFKNVEFSYENGNGELVLSNINLKINAKEKIGIVGSTGSGKTTLVNLIARYYDITKGSILIDDKDIREYDLNFIRKKIVLAMQQPIIFSGTIKENLKYASSNITDEKMIDVAKLTLADEFICKMENKYNDKIEQDASNFSGGEKQRLSLTRALLANPDILILDDVTSALDLATDKKVRQNINKNYNITTLIISSRISTVINTDKIIVLDDGKIVGFDKHENLLKNNKIYQEIYNSQNKEGNK